MKLADYPSKHRAGDRSQWKLVAAILRRKPSSIREIADVLDWPYYKVENVIQRMRKADQIELVHYWKLKENEHESE